MSTDLKPPGEARSRLHLPEIRLPHFDWRVFDRSQRRPAGGDGEPPPPRKRWRPGWGSAIAGVVVLAIVLFLAFFDWNLLRGPIGRWASAQSGREIRLEGNLKVRLLTLTPRVDVGGLTIGNPSWGPKENMAEVGDVAVAAKLLPLFIGRLELPLVSIDRPNVSLLRDAQGRANWDFSNGRRAERPLKLPPIQTFVINDGRLRVQDLGRRLTFDGTVNAHEERAAAYDRGFRLVGKGELNRRAFAANVTGGPLINVRTDRPYPFDAVVTQGPTRVTAKGQVPKPFDLGVLNAQVTVSGRDLNDLYDLTGLVLPNTPPYRATGNLRRDGRRYYYDGFAGRIGTSDIRGDASVDMTGERPFLKARLNSRLLDFADLAGIFGVPGASRAAAPDQKAEARALAAQGRLLPDATLQVERIRGMDAEVHYKADRVRAPNNLPLRTVEIGAKLDRGLLTLAPLSLDFPTGRLAGDATINARGATPVSRIDFRISNMQLAQFIPPVSGSRPVQGTLLARARLTGSGNSVHRAASNANGAVTIVIPRGQMRQAFAELLGIDVTKGLFLLITGDQDPTEIRCGVANFRATNGTLHADRIIFDTGVVRVEGSGEVDLERETLNLTFKGEPKKLRAVRVIAPITVQGRLRQPRFGLEPGPAIAQAGIGAVLGAVLSPLAAILPFVSPGLEEDANCAALLAEARQGTAPVPAAPPPRNR